jgi:anti-sigma regulatory factor (Ser/Thr protein kinase)
MAESPESLHLSLAAEPENISEARMAAVQAGEGLGLWGDGLDVLRTVVSEAVTNVVRHAYPEGGGTFALTIGRVGGEVVVTVRDFGVGLRPRIEDGDSLRLGLGLIAILSSHYEISGHPEGGTEIRIRVPVTA